MIGMLIIGLLGCFMFGSLTSIESDVNEGALGIKFKQESYESYLDGCQRALKNGFTRQGHTESWMLLRVPPVYRSEIIKKLQSEYPTYDIETYEISGIWIWGDEEVEFAAAKYEVDRGFWRIIDAREKHIQAVLLRLRQAYPSKRFEIIVDENSKEVISIDGWVPEGYRVSCG